MDDHLAKQQHGVVDGAIAESFLKNHDENNLNTIEIIRVSGAKTSNLDD
ncbi:hypothetical protein [Spirulina major]|nr:hypothetical protein [Spirulina major]